MLINFTNPVKVLSYVKWTCPNKIKTRTEHKIGSLKFREGDAG